LKPFDFALRAPRAFGTVVALPAWAHETPPDHEQADEYQHSDVRIHIGSTFGAHPSAAHTLWNPIRVGTGELIKRSFWHKRTALSPDIGAFYDQIQRGFAQSWAWARILNSWRILGSVPPGNVVRSYSDLGLGVDDCLTRSRWQGI
jgi:hypothetical protein